MAYTTIKDLPDVLVTDLSGNEYIMVTEDDANGTSSKFTLDSLTGYIGDNFDRDVDAKLALKVDKVNGKGLSTNDYTTLEKTKLSGIEDGAQVNDVTTVAGRVGDVVLTKSDVGLSNVDNTADSSKNVLSATKLTTSRTINGIGFDGTSNITITANTPQNEIIKFDSGTVEGTDLYTFNGSAAKSIDIKAGTNISLTKTAGSITINANDTSVDWSEIQNKPDPTITLAGDLSGAVTLTDLTSGTLTATIVANSVALGTDTTGNYVAGNTAGTGITISGTAGEGWSPTIAITNVGTAGTYTKVTTNAQGQVTSGTTLSATDIPSLDASKITTGIIDAARLPAYVDDVLEFANLAGFPATGETGKIYVALDTNKTYRWSGTVYVYITSGAVDSVNGQTGIVNITTITGNAGTATKLETARTISLSGDVTGSVSFDGSANASITATIAANSVALGTDTTGNYVAGITQGTGITVSGTAGEGWSPTVALSTSGVGAGTYKSVTVDTYGRVTAGTNPTTLTGFGITDAYTKTEVQTILPKVGFDTTNTTAPSVGQVAWNIDENTLDIGLNGATLQVGQEQLIRVRNNTVSSISNGSVVMATGTIGNSGRISIAPANLTQSNAKYILGIVTETIAAGADGFVTTFGKVRGIDTTGTSYGETWVDGDVLYVKDSGNGALTKVVPTDTQVKLPTAIVVHAHTSGTLFVRVNSIDENHAKAELALKANINSPTLVTPNIGVATGTSFNSITGLSSSTPLVAGTASIGTGTTVARADHIHPVQTTITGNAGTATALQTARSISLTGDITGSVSFDGSANASITTTIAANSVALGTDTTGNYVAGNTAGTGITVSGTAGEGWSPTIAIANVGTAGTYTKVTTNAQGQVTAGTTLSATDIPALDASKITSGIIDAARLPAYVDDVLEFANLAGFPATGETGKIYVALDNNKTYRWSGTVYVYITSGAVDSVNGQTGIVNITTITGNSGTATALQTARTIGGVSFDGSANINLPGVNAVGNQNTTGSAATLTTGRTIGMTGDVTWTSATFNGSTNVTGTSTLSTITDSGIGSFKKITTDTKGRVTGTQAVIQSDITGLLGAGSITNTMIANTAVSNLSGTNTGDETIVTIKTKLGITTLSGSNTGDQTITLTGDVTGTGTGSFATTLSNSGVTAGTYTKVTVDSKGRVTAGLTPTMEDIPDATFKRSVKAATTANITLSATQTIDGIALVAGDRVLVKNQTTTSQNGIYVVNSGAWARASDADTSSKISSALVAVDSGTINGGKLFDNDFKTTDTLGTTAMTWNANLDDGSLLASTSTSVGIVKYNGTTATAGNFDGGTATPTGTSRLNYGGYFYPTYLNLMGSADTATASSHVFVETASDGFVRPKTLANFKTEMFASPTLVTPNIGVATGTSFNSITGLASVAPLVAGTATVGTSTLTARQDHVHPAQTSVTGNAGTATALQTARTINGVSFDGTANITVPAQTPISNTEYITELVRNTKQVYGIEVDIGTMPNATIKSVAFTFNPLYTYWIDNQNSYCDSSSASYPLNYTGNIGESISCYLDKTNNVIKVSTSDDKSSFTGKVILLYTK